MSRRFMTWLLHSQFADLVDPAILLMTVRGRRSGNAYTFPVQYAEGEGGVIWVFPAGHDRKTWWRNLASESTVTVRVRGRDLEARAQAFAGMDAPATVEVGLRTYVDRFGAVGRRMGVVDRAGNVDESRLAAAAKDGVMVRIEPLAFDALPLEVAQRPEETHVTGALGFVRRQPLRAFYLLTFLLSWGYWIPDAVAGGRWSHAPGLLGPMIAALVVTAVSEGGAGLRAFARRMFRWRVPIHWYLWVLAPVGLALATASLMSLVSDSAFPSFMMWSEMGGFAGLGGWSAYAVIFVVNGYGEEAGWRGYATPAFLRRHGELTTSLLVAIPWAVWHLPTFFIDSGYRDFPLFFVPGWLLGVFALAVVMTWFTQGARSSILMAALMHLSLNVATTTSATEGTVSAVVTGAVIVWSIVIAGRWRRDGATTRTA